MVKASIRVLGPILALLLSAAAPPPGHWTPAWTASMWQATGDRPGVNVADETIRFSVQVNAGGNGLRLNLSNQYGQSFRIGTASVRIAGGEPVPVTFAREAGLAVPAGATIASDTIKAPVKAFDVVEVSLYFPDKAFLNTIHNAGGAKTFVSPPGDHTRVAFEPARRSDNRPLMSSVEVLGAAKRPVIVAYGDSITDNTGCAINAVPNCRWGDVLARRLAAARKPHVVVTQAISGNRVLGQGGVGPGAVERFERDVLSLPNVTHVVLLEGVNDIGGSGRKRPDGTVAPTITAEQLIAGYRSMIARAHSKKIKVIGMTILPFEGAGYHSEAGEAMRVKVNDWILTSGAFDGVFDMAKVVATPGYPNRLNPDLQRGDNLHPDGRGETKMGEAIPLDLIK